MMIRHYELWFLPTIGYSYGRIRSALCYAQYHVLTEMVYLEFCTRCAIDRAGTRCFLKQSNV